MRNENKNKTKSIKYGMDADDGNNWKLIRKSKCQFCLAFFDDDTAYAEHSEYCVSRLSAFLASDGRIKFACMVCRDVFDNPNELTEHEQLHKYPGGFPCTSCYETFSSESNRVHHNEKIHETFKCLRCENEKFISTEESYAKHCEIEHNGESGYAICLECGASFEEKSFLRFHSETECGHFRSWTCYDCAAVFVSENALTEHMGSHLPNGSELKLEIEDFKVDFALIDCGSEHEVMLNEKSITDSEHSDSMGVELSHYSDDEQTPDGTLPFIKVEIADPRVEIEEEQDDFFDKIDENKCMSARVAQRTCKLCGLVVKAARYLPVHMRRHKIYKCPKCGISCAGKRILAEHIGSDCGRLSFNVDRSFKCKFCEKTFQRKINMLTHMATHTGVKPFKCPACDDRFTNMTQLQSHRKLRKSCMRVRMPSKNEYLIDVETQHPSNSIRGNNSNDVEDNESKNTIPKLKFRRTDRIRELAYACKCCDQKYTSKKHLERHNALHGSDGKLVHKCECCSTYFATIEERVEHKNEVHLDELSCEYCRKVFSSPHLLKAHIRYKHRENAYKTSYVCIKCGKSLPNKRILDDHEKSDCNRNPMYKCDECGKCLSTEYALRAHLLTHNEDSKKFICTYCGKAWRTKGQLKLHSRIHTGEKPYKCKYCDMQFCHRTTKITHESVHTGFKQYLCQGCGNRFSCVSNLQSHRRARKSTCGLLPLISRAFPQIEVAEKL